MLTLPGLIDPHTHPRGLPSDEHKEDYFTATAAALAGGYTTIMDLPNNPYYPTITYQRMVEKQNLAREKILCDVGFFFGTNGENKVELKEAEKVSKGLKVFLNTSTGNLVINLQTFEQICKAWTPNLPIVLHAEEDILEDALEITYKTGHHTHVYHISSESELRKIIKAKQKRYNVTCGVTPHHLFLTNEYLQKKGNYGKVAPSLKTSSDNEFLWGNLTSIDVIESDHAPHTKEEKESNNPPFGLPGLETTLPLLLTAVSEKKLTLEKIIDLCFDKPAKIFNLPTDPETKVEVDEKEEWEIKNENLFTKCKWSPFDGWIVKGRVKKVVIRGTIVFENNYIRTTPGFGRIILPKT